jgi:hypothetical protein
VALTPKMLERWSDYFDARNEGYGTAEAARKASIDRSTAHKFERGDPSSSGIQAAHELGVNVVGGTLIQQPIPPEAQRALDDFAYFRLRYFGRKSTPWQERAAYSMLEKLDTPEREYMVINAPSGGGKSTLFTHDIPAWLIARNRQIRIMIGSRTERQARMYVGRLKRTLEREAPMRQDPDLVRMGLAQDAEATMSDDYTPFKPENRSDLWRTDELRVRSTDGQSADDKEATLSAWGQDSGFLGGRFDLVIWDDLVDKRNTRTEESMNNLIEWYGSEAESRIEPGGLIVLQGQRIKADDLYRYALDKENLDGTKKYHHIKYAAHDETLCENHHETDDERGEPQAWPNGCLLDPHRLPWKFLATTRDTEPRTFNLMFQQDDTDTFGGLVHREWLEGGMDDDGHIAPGCYDTDRKMREPQPLLNGAFSFMTIDPSPTEYWGIEWWLWDDQREALILMDCKRTRLTPEQFLYLDLDSGQFSGLLHDWHRQSVLLGHAITHVVVEINAAQRWLLSQPHVQRWQTLTGVTLVPHSTGINKNDAEYGVETLGGWFKHGKIRIPTGDPQSRLAADPLIKELLNYPNGKTTDMVMSTWFATLSVHKHFTGRQQGRYQRARTGLVNTARGLAFRR